MPIFYLTILQYWILFYLTSTFQFILLSKPFWQGAESHQTSRSQNSTAAPQPLQLMHLLCRKNSETNNKRWLSRQPYYLWKNQILKGVKQLEKHFFQENQEPSKDSRIIES